ncbi:hypothetical protein PM082_003737 [Marasmius tenuissimus]|nr:hypothetical protein PM082_003737 [Marasmius tenuissimus]
MGGSDQKSFTDTSDHDHSKRYRTPTGLRVQSILIAGGEQIIRQVRDSSPSSTRGKFGGFSFSIGTGPRPACLQLIALPRRMGNNGFWACEVRAICCMNTSWGMSTRSKSIYIILQGGWIGRWTGLSGKVRWNGRHHSGGLDSCHDQR